MRRPRGRPLNVASHRRPSMLSVRGWRVRTKLISVLAVPLLSFLAVAGLQITAAVGSVSTLDNLERQVRSGQQISTLVHELQRERDRTAGMLASLAGSPRDTAGLAPEWTAVDRAVQALRGSAGSLRDDAATASAYRLAERQLDDLAQIRDGVRQGWLRAPAAFDMYTSTIASLNALLVAPAGVGDQGDLGQFLRGVNRLATAKELTAQIRGYLYMMSFAGFDYGDFEKVANIRAEQQAAWEQFRAEAHRSQLSAFDDVVTGQAVHNAARLQQDLLDKAGKSTGSSTLGTVPGNGGKELADPQQWWLASTTELEMIQTVEKSLLDRAADEVAAASTRQWTTTGLAAAAIVGLLLFAVLTSLYVGRRMADTLHQLRDQALQVAERRLPAVIEQLRLSPTKVPSLHVEPVAVGSRDEVGEVAEAFTAVHRSAVRLAAEQAAIRRSFNETLVTLARRSQTLVERQLNLLDQMESSEVDADQLAQLFQLDHLATRLRRNDENLLVLAGSDSTRRFSVPVELSTVVTAATAEIEHYPRVHHDIGGDLHLVGYVVADLVHIVAELLENATAFSHPDTAVHVSMPVISADGAVELMISDEGIGMAADALQQANQVVTAPESINTSAAERMGLVVVGHLARRHGIRVSLHSGTPGIVVRIGIPGRLVVPAPDDETGGFQASRWLHGQDPAPTTTVPKPRRSPERGPGVPGDNDDRSVWWSKDAAQQRKSAPAAIVTPRPQVVVSTTSAGLPKRARGQAADVAPPVVTLDIDFPEMDPDETGNTLTRLYAGIRQASTETEPQDLPQPLEQE